MSDKSEKTILAVPISGSENEENPQPSGGGQGAGERFSLAQGSDNDSRPEESIEERASKMATKAGQRLLDWQASYTSLINQISGFYAVEINKLIHPINIRLGAFLNGLRWDLEQEPQNILRQAQADFASLRGNALNYQSDRAEFMGKLEHERRIFPNLTEDDVRKTDVKTTGSWILFAAILAVMVLGESAANMALLASALEGGLIQAFMVATLVSIINVAGIGAGAGFLYAFLFRKLRNVFYAVLPVWFAALLILNLLVGRHRENFILDIEAKEHAAEANASNLSEGLSSLVVSSSEITEVSLNPVAWHFESGLFFLLGMVLCSFGFYKGLSFMRPGENIKPFLDKLDKLKQKIEQGIGTIPAQCGERLVSLRKKVADEIVKLDQIVKKAENDFEDMEVRWDIIINVIETEFVNSYNQAHPSQKISMDNIRSAEVAASFPATEADRGTIVRGKKSVSDYENEVQTKFYDTVASINSQILDMQHEYRQALDSLMNTPRS